MECDGWKYDTKNKRIYPLFPSISEEHELTDSRSSADTIEADPYFSPHSLLGAFVVFPLDAMDDNDLILFKILCAWMGHKLNNRLIAEHHISHLRFINALGRDIGHNIIIPNMYLKYLFRKLEKQIILLKDIEEKGEQLALQCQKPELCRELVADCIKEQQELETCHQELIQHHNQISMFLESLFREEHFTRGHFVVQPKKTYVERDIIIPQLELFADRLANQGITIDKPHNMYEQEYPLMVDVGLLSQVYANLFSNAVKYTTEIVDHQGKPRKAVAYGSEEVNAFPKPGMKGIKFNVFTTGTPLTEDELTVVFREGGRADNAEGIRGSGHGLDFIGRVIEVHGGKAGCEASEQGNNFYFILPLSPDGA
ncbi:MAG: sensor histidine kinase [Desulfocapsa sp.]|nr:MAG: sensor histidine kinase [Desulfocapsa sp.]